MKKVLSVISVILVLVCLVSCFAACNAGGVPAGTYKLTALSEGDQDYTEYLALLGDATLTVNNDNTATMSIYGETVNLTIDPEAHTIANESGEAYNYTLEGNKIIFEQDDTKMTFEKQ